MTYHRRQWAIRGTLLLASAALLLSTFSSAGAQSTLPVRQASVTWRTYGNARYGYSIQYPAPLLAPQGEAANGDGQAFLSQNGKTQLLVYGSNNVLDETIASRFARDRRSGSGKKVAYAKQRNNWYAVSGYERGKVFYHKCYQVGDHFVTFEITYPESERAVWDKTVSRISETFQPKLRP